MGLWRLGDTGFYPLRSQCWVVLAVPLPSGHVLSEWDSLPLLALDVAILSVGCADPAFSAHGSPIIGRQRGQWEAPHIHAASCLLNV